MQKKRKKQVERQFKDGERFPLHYRLCDWLVGVFSSLLDKESKEPTHFFYFFIFFFWFRWAAAKKETSQSDDDVMDGHHAQTKKR